MKQVQQIEKTGLLNDDSWIGLEMDDSSRLRLIEDQVQRCYKSDNDGPNT